MQNGDEKNNGQNKIISTNKAQCRDCYRCLRVCPVKAIKMVNGQAFVDPTRCILCGTCVLECPQKAKVIRNDIGKAIDIIKNSELAAVSIAPSFVAVFKDWQQKRICSALRKLGFKHISETAIGADIVAKLTAHESNANLGKPIICSACPAVVNYIEKYTPELIPNLAQIVSPMIAHAKYLKEKLGKQAKIIFIGPCIAKKSEAERPEYKGLIDAVLTFNELNEWLKIEQINLSECEESSFDDFPKAVARYFPLIGGLIKTASLDTNGLAPDIISVSGFEDIKSAILNLNTEKGAKIEIIEPLFCHQGCINGPAISVDTNLFERRKEVIDFANEQTGKKSLAKVDSENFKADYKHFKIEEKKDITEEEIQKVLALTGKLNPEDELNCGACGYNSCRDKAVAVIKGMAEVEMCIPYMRMLAERRTDKIIETSPNGIVILDDRLNIISMNAAFKKMFLCTEVVIGKKISYLIDPSNFEKLATGESTQIEIVEKYSNYNIVCHEILYTMPEEKQYVGIFINITNLEKSQEELENIRQKTVQQARELLEHQINMAQQMAKLLGENTARGEELVTNLMKISDEDSEKNDDGRKKII
ncbi:MAG: [Fe-Fe] hydrogenase large subunit C-terminal domain-containing protein [Candidatus Wallbacteria bacterium]